MTSLQSALSALGEALCILGCTQRSPHLRLLTFASIVCLAVCLFLNPTGSAYRDYTIGCSAAIRVFMMSDFLLLNDPLKFRKLNEPAPPPSSEASLSVRLKRSFDLVYAPRGVGWTHRIRGMANSAPNKSTATLPFLAKRMKIFVVQFILYELADLVIQANQHFPPLLSDKWWLRALVVIAHLTELRTRLLMTYELIIIGRVVTGLSEPDESEWPPLFGSVLEVYTVRRFWGQFWHQVLRRMLTTHSDFLAQCLGLRKRLIARYFKLHMAFFISAIVHYCGDFTIRQDWKGGSMHYFLLQAAAITVEDALIYAGRRLGCERWMSKRWARLLGYAWVMAWFAATHPIWLGPQIEVGFVTSRPPNVFRALQK
ncbi:toxin biosynthesis protein [Coprinopsis cinerea okayama7|uniref:Toxin biosynthesis protein n=1 Tax=Coprinopsis cinerea (strain Okayama-7 / 130 / ATCC MYA-4618 / FGSC 9003) TaxID=240176 RepID=D6RLR8_COPC7|nr:toxin biosynthesis protein [Coprinopsis cinerea okayama7\|eukprot:XP_002911745.1 toxin biosynthesis protein [Coprinopsis cinerea okayama7\